MRQAYILGLFLVVAACSPSAGPSPWTPGAATSPPTPTATIRPAPTVSPIASPGSTASSTPRPTPFGSPTTAFDLRRTAWRVLVLPGHSLTAEATPTIDFGLDPTARGPATTDSPAMSWNGCNYFSFRANLSGGQIANLTIDRHDGTCGAFAVRDAFMAFFVGVIRWVVIGDFLVLTAPAGHLELLRELPPAGDPGRALADALLAGQWRIASATGVQSPGAFAPLYFADRWFATTEPGDRGPSATGDTGSACGFGGSIAFLAGGALRIEAGFDTIYCGEGDERPAIATTLNQITTGALESPARARLTGPQGEVVLENR